MSAKERAIRNIVELGEVRHSRDRYATEYSRPVTREGVEQDWYRGLYLLLSDSFYQGRRDEVSEKVGKVVMEVLDARFDGRDVSALTGCDFASLLAGLLAVVGKGKVGKARDTRMVVGIFRFVSRLSEKNLARHSVAAIRRGDIQKLYEELNGIEGNGVREGIARAEKDDDRGQKHDWQPFIV